MKIVYICGLLFVASILAIYFGPIRGYCPLPELRTEMNLGSSSGLISAVQAEDKDMKDKSDEFWRSKLTPEQYRVRHGGTEERGTGKYYKFDEAGNYLCSNCGAVLFSSKDKYNSGSGWPSFSQVAKSGAVELLEDHSHGMDRTEVRCANCGAHLGHVFDDGPGPEGKRYCINSVSLDHKSSEESSK